MILIGDGIKYYRSAALLGYRFLPSGKDEKAPFLRSETADGQQYLNLGNVPVVPMQPLGGSSAGMIVKREFVTTVPISTAPHSEPPAPGQKLAPYTRDGELEYASKISAILFTDGLSKPVELDTGDLKPVIAALQACTDDLLKYWGLDVAKHRNESRVVQPDGDTSEWLPSGTIGFEDYPKLSGGANMIQLMVDATGKPNDCKIHFASLDDDTNAKLCGALLANAHFKPALDADGKPFASFYTTSPLNFGGGGFGR
jgi:hypothetical protein